MRMFLRLMLPAVLGLIAVNFIWLRMGPGSTSPLPWLFTVVLSIWLLYTGFFDQRRVRKALGEIQKHLTQDSFRRPFVPYEVPDLADFASETQKAVRNLRERLKEGSLEQNLLRSLLNGLREGVICVNRDGKIVFRNESLPAVLVDAGGLGEPYWCYVRDPTVLEFLQALKTSPPDPAPQVRDVRARDRFYVVHGVQIAAGAEAELVLLIVYDRTDERRTQAMREDFLQNASHELRTPLTSIRGYTETLLARSPDAQSQSFLEAVLRNTERMERLVEDMSTISSMEARMTAVRPETMDVRQFLERLADLVSGLLKRKNLHLEIDAAGPLSLEADPVLLEHLFLNLIDNAARYSPQGESIRVSAHVQDDGRILFQVADRGPGVEESIRERIFERFFRADPNRSREAGGTGLGLSIVRHITLLHEGRVWVEDRPGGGAVFFVRLPSNQPKRPRM